MKSRDVFFVKRFFVLIMLALLFFCFVLLQYENMTDLNFKHDYKYVIEISGNTFNSQNASTTHNGNGLILTAFSGQEKKLFSEINAKNQKIKAQSLVFEAQSKNVAQSILHDVISVLEVNILEKYEVEGRTIFEGYSFKLNEFFKKHKTKTNIQIAVSENAVVVGYPVILHSF